MQVADAAAGLGDRLAFDFQDESQYAVCGRMLRTHIDDDAFLTRAVKGFGDGVPVLAGDRDHSGFGPGVVVDAGPGVDVVHYLYALRSSGGGMRAPLYSTGIPPSG